MPFLVPTLRLVLIALPLIAAGCATRSGDGALGSDARLRVAQAAEESGDYRLAEDMTAAAAEAAPTDADVQLRYVDVLLRRGKVKQAGDVLSSHLRTVSDPQKLRGGLGGVYVLEGEPALAIAEFDSLLSADPGNMRILVNKAIALDLLGRHQDAQSLYRQALAAEPDDPVVINNLALSLMLAGRTHEAADVAAPLRAQSDMIPRIRAGLGVVLAANGDLAGAHAVIGATATDDQLSELARAAAAAAHP